MIIVLKTKVYIQNEERNYIKRFEESTEDTTTDQYGIRKWWD